MYHDSLTLDLQTIPLFRDLCPDQLSHLQGLFRCRTFPAGTNILTLERPTHFVYVILEGTIKVRALHEDGTELTLAILGPGEVISDMLLEENATYAVMVATIEETRLLWLPRDAFQQCLQTMPSLTYNFMQILSRRLHATHSYMRSVLKFDVNGRLAYRLLHFAREYGQPRENGDVLIPMRLTQSDLAELIGASRVRVNHAFAALKRLGYLSTDTNRFIVIHDLDALTRLCQ